MPPIEIAYFLNALGMGGTEKSAVLFANHLSSCFRVTFFTYSDADLTRQDEVRHLELIDRQNPDFSVLSEFDLVHAFRSGQPERPHPGQDFRAKYIETNTFGLLDPNTSISRSLFMSKWLMDASLATYGVSGPRYDFVNNPVEHPKTSDKIDIDVPEDAVVLGRCGRPDPGIHDGISVMAAHIAQLFGIKVHFLVVAPPPPMIEDMKSRRIGYTIIEPTIDPIELSRFYNTIDIYCHARADGETFGVNIAEAMIHAKPVITHWATPKVPGMSVFQNQTELVEDQKTGFVCRTARAYADAIRDLAESPDLRLSMGHAGYKKAHSECLVINLLPKLEGIYRAVLEE